MKVWSSIVKGNVFPAGRKTACCGVKTKKGESVLIIQVNKQNGLLDSYAVIHRRCLLPLVESMPLDADEYTIEYERIRSLYSIG